MIPVLFRTLSRFAPMVTLPIAAIIGVIGYNIESLVSDKYTPFQKDSIQEKRLERLAEEAGDLEKRGSLKERKFVPQTIFEKNLSPSLK